jgi:tmRNA-binding protein
MKDIKIGEYVRTDTGEIYIMKYFIKEFDYSKIKHSQNIIDLIEVGDYVNGYRITDIGNDCVEIEDGGTQIKKNEIKSIVTKEQFENVSYSFDN